MTKRTKVLTDDDPLPWTDIRPPTDRMRDHLRYLRGELGFVMCRKFAAFECVVCPCPIMWDEDDELIGEHEMTICRRGQCDNVSISCSERHDSKAILEAILEEL